MSSQFKILIVDDNEDARYSLRKVLQNPVYEFFEAHDAASSLKMVEEIQPDIVLLDVRMPGIDGFQVCESIRRSIKHIPIVFVTANVKDFTDQIRGFEKGGDDYIIQPYDSQELVIKVKALLRNKRLYDELFLEAEKLEKLKQDLEMSNSELKNLNLKLHETNEFLHSLVITDPLTSLYNKKYFHQRIQKEISAVRRYQNETATVMIDIDQFTALNQQYGALQGDHILKELAGLLVRSVRDSDVVIRYDGGKFVVLFTHTSESNAMVKAVKIRDLINPYSFSIYEDVLSVDKTVRDQQAIINITVTMTVLGLNHDWIRNDSDYIQCMDVSLQETKQQGTDRIALGRRIV